MTFVKISKLALELGLSSNTIKKHLKLLRIEPSRTAGGLYLLTEEQVKQVKASIVPRSTNSQVI